MAENKQKWCAARALYSTSFQVVPDVQARQGCNTWVEHSPKVFADYDKAQADAERMTAKHKCAEWEFAELVSKFEMEARRITSNQEYFLHGMHSEVREQIWAVIDMAKSMSNAMVAQELMNRTLKKKWG